jgi:hypothetical protein
MSTATKKKVSKKSVGKPAASTKREGIRARTTPTVQTASREIAARASERNLTPDLDVFIYTPWERFWMNVRAFFGAQP